VLNFQIVEQDSIHSVRCKLYYKKGKEFTEKGLGMLYLKNVDSEEGTPNKTQLLVRAETNLGNILLNILLNKQMNLTKRNNCVQFVCIPNPEIPGIKAGTPVTMLVKVKNADLASILEDEIKKEIDNM
jgi:nuclear pore complex protein Nup50